jgi:hypothetical protein
MVSPRTALAADGSAKKFCAAGGRDGSLRGMSTPHRTHNDQRERLDLARDSADVDAGQPIQPTWSAATREGLVTLARLLARQAAAEAVRGAIAPAGSGAGAAT